MRWGCLAMLAMLAACGKGAAPVVDAGVEHLVSDAPPPPADQQIPLSIDFTVENCPSFDPDPENPSCTGKVPLAVRFVPLATTLVTKYRWNFDDYSEFSLEPAPSHVFTTPGVYTIKLIVNGWEAIRTRPGFIVAQASALGEPCDNSTQCQAESGLFCLCPPHEACSLGLARGVCIAECVNSRCGTDEVCADLVATEQPPLQVEPWQTALCLPKCTSDADCREGMRCRTLKPGPQGGGWVHGCFAEIPRDIGEPCTDATGKRRDDFCASGLCIDYGVQGMCSMDCEQTVCPTGSDCALFGNGERLCVRGCVAGNECRHDPLLPCMPPTSGELGYQLAGDNPADFAQTHCAPKSCGEDADCLPAGRCDDPEGDGHCVPR